MSRRTWKIAGILILAHWPCSSFLKQLGLIMGLNASCRAFLIDRQPHLWGRSEVFHGHNPTTRCDTLMLGRGIFFDKPFKPGI